MMLSYWATQDGVIHSCTGAVLSPAKATAMRDFYLADILAVELRPVDPETTSFIQDRDLRCATELRAAIAAVQSLGVSA